MYIVVGQGAAGTTAAKELRRLNPTSPITVITDEEDYFYSRIDLPDIIAGKFAAAASMLYAKEQFAKTRIGCRMGERVMAVDAGRKQVELQSGVKVNYAKLLLATGSAPVIPPISGAKAKGVYALWTMNQAEAIIHAADRAKAAVVIGSGLIGMKTALALAARGLKVTVVEKLPRVLPRQLDAQASEILIAQVRAKNVCVKVDSVVERIEENAEGSVCGVTVSGCTIACDLVIMAAGVRPNTELAIASGIDVRRGIVVDKWLQTSAVDVYAAGDVAEVADCFSGLPAVPAIWPVAVEQGLAAARNMTGTNAPYFAGSALNSVEIAGVPLVSVGDVEGNSNDEVFRFHKEGCYRKVVMSGRTVKGVLCVGDIRHAGVLANLVLRRTAVDCGVEIAYPSFSFAALMAM